MRTIALIGPSADDPSIQAHTYHGTPAKWTTLREALVSELRESSKAGGGAGGGDPSGNSAGGDAVGSADGVASAAPEATVRVLYEHGCAIDDRNTSGFAAALTAASQADVIVYAGGLYQLLEEEDTDRMDSKQHPNGLGLPGAQLPLLAKLRAVANARSVPLIALLVSGGPLAVPSLVPPSAEAPDALLWSSYYGQSARPLARILLGTVLPSGRLPFTVPFNASSLPPIADYSMSAFPGRTYRYLDTDAAPPLFPFGHGIALGPAWTISQLVPSASTLTLRGLRVAAASPCSEVAGTALVVRLKFSRAAAEETHPSRRMNVKSPWERLGTARVGGEAGSESPLDVQRHPNKSPDAATADAPTTTDLSAPPLDVSAHSTTPLNASYSVLLFAALGSTTGPRSPFPRKQLLAFTKPTLQPGESASLTVRVCARDLLDEGLGAHTQPMPNTLRLWVGDASGLAVEAEALLDIDEDSTLSVDDDREL